MTNSSSDPFSAASKYHFANSSHDHIGANKQAQGSRNTQSAHGGDDSDSEVCLDLFGHMKLRKPQAHADTNKSKRSFNAKTSKNTSEVRLQGAAPLSTNKRTSRSKACAVLGSQLPDSFWGEELNSSLEKEADAADRLEEDLPDDAYTVVQVAVNRALYTSYDYKIRGKYRTEILGSRIKITFGHRGGKKEIGIISGLGANSTLPMKRIKEGILLDKVSLIQRDVFETLCFAASYYHYPLGQTLVLGLPKLLRDGEEASYKKIVGLRIKLDSIIVEDLLPMPTVPRNAHVVEANLESDLFLEEKVEPTIVPKVKGKQGEATGGGAKGVSNIVVAAADEENELKLEVQKVESVNLNLGAASSMAAQSKSIREREQELFARKLDLAGKRLRSKRQRELLMLLSSGPKRSRELREQGFSALQENALLNAGVAERIDFAQEVKPFDLIAAAAQGPMSLTAINAEKGMSDETGKIMEAADSWSASLPPSPAIDGILHSAPLALNADQQHCLDVINSYKGYGVFLINGVTGSGKTEVYLQVIEDCLRHGKQVLILVPEIALTPQTFKRFYERFQVPIATLHSTLSSRERLDAFLDIQKRRAVILIGTRSALFTSIPDLGLIVIDEEHDSSFKQTDNLRYHARTLAIHRARLCQCKVILGSATPSLESVFHAQMGHYLRLDLLHRAKSVTMPKLHIVDLKQEEFSENVKAGVGTVIEEAIGEATAQHQQALLFLNRRGFSHSMVCHTCGHLIMCPHCDTPLTVHYFNNQLQCHICNCVFPIPTVCPFCGATDGLVETGLGTEQVESYLQDRFMDVGVARIDRDIITTKQELEEALRHVRSHKSEILIGTQMLAKGHDFPDLTMVGILDVDAGIYTEDFHGLEYTAQLVTQVAGRAGRDNCEGKVFIQTRFPHHPLLLQLTEPNFNYYDLALDLLRVRREQGLPPYTYNAFVMTNSYERDFAFETLKRLIDDLFARTELIKHVNFSPIESDRIERRFNRFHFHVQISSAHKAELHKVLDELVHIFDSYKNMRDLRFAIDVDPVTSS